MAEFNSTIAVEAHSDSGSGSFISPNALFLLDENRPDDCLPMNDSVFQISQQENKNGGRATGRQYILVHFLPTPCNSYGCELHWSLPENTQFLSYYGSHQLDVKLTKECMSPFCPTWNGIINGNPSSFPPGVFGTINAVAGTNTVVNTAGCSNQAAPGIIGNGYGLAFVFKFADWIEQSGEASGLSFTSGSLAPKVFVGPFLNFNR